MKCSVIKDILPLYCDRLTSPETNEEIESHLAECAECRKIYENMITKEDIIEVPETDVKPLKKAKKRIALKTLAAFAGAAAVLGAVFLFVFWGVVPASFRKVTFTVEVINPTNAENSAVTADSSTGEQQPVEDNMKLWLSFTSDYSCVRFTLKTDYIYYEDGSIGSKYDLWVYPQVKLPFDNRGEHPNEFDIGCGEVQPGETLTVHYLDRDVEYDLCTLAQNAAEKADN